MLRCLEIAADLIHDGTKTVDKIKQIPRSDTTDARRCDSTEFKTTTNLEDIESPLFWHTVGQKH